MGSFLEYIMVGPNRDSPVLESNCIVLSATTVLVLLILTKGCLVNLTSSPFKVVLPIILVYTVTLLFT